MAIIKDPPSVIFNMDHRCLFLDHKGTFNIYEQGKFRAQLS